MDQGRPDDDMTLPNIFGGAVDPPSPSPYPPPPAQAPTPEQQPTLEQQSWTTESEDDTARHTLLPGWAPAAATQASTLPPRPERRKAALFGVLGVVVATVAVLLVAIFVAPNWGNSADNNETPPPALSSSASTSAAPTTSELTSSAPSSRASATASQAPPVKTVTVTATPTPVKPTTGPGATTKVAPTSRAAPPTKTTPKTRATPTTKSTPPATPLGVPEAQIACGGGYIVQLASEFNRESFAARIQDLKSSGLLPDGARAADSTKSCGIFSNQTNTLVLYSGPFGSPYDGCKARLAGPYDAFIKGASPETSGTYVSCLCPANTGALPRISKIGDTDVWVGELQRVLGSRLDVNVGPLGPDDWGRYTVGTRDAVKRFQQAAKLPSTGVVNQRTWKAVQSAEC